VATAPTEDFAKLIMLAELDPWRHLRFVDWSGLSFRGCDLRFFNFTGARLVGCDFRDARIEGARFDQAEIDAARPYARIEPKRTNLRAAKDWDAYARGWRCTDDLSPDDHLPVGAIFQDAPFAPEMVVVPAGEFWMGSPDGSGGDRGDEEEPGRLKYEGPRHRVTIAQAFAVGRFAVTFEEWDWAQAHPDWRRHSGRGSRRPRDEEWGRGRRPAINVSWDDAQAYCRWLAAVTGKPYRLPSEAEWECCCRAGTETPFWRGASISTEQANYAYGGGAKGEYRQRTVPVDSFEANLWGLYQVHGNVWEWCQDAWHGSYEAAPDDGSARLQDADASRRVLRGGSWFNDPRFLRSACRDWFTTDFRDYVVGFRVVRTLES
jgi:formylglycine-generating enzyme required for sulfatase activity